MNYEPPGIDTPWSYGIWEGKFIVCFSYTSYGWIQMAIMSTVLRQSVVIYCSDTFDPFPGMQEWLESIANNKFPAEWTINEEGWLRKIRVLRYDDSLVDFQIWEESDDNKEAYPPKLILRLRCMRSHVLTEFYNRFTRYVKEDYDPSQWDMTAQSYDEIWSDLRNIDLANIKAEIDISEN